VVTPVAGFSSAVVVRGATGGDTRWNRLRKVVQAQPDEELQSVPRREYSVANRIKDGATHSYTLRSTAMDSGRRSDSDLCLSPAPLLPTMYKDGQAPHPNRRYFITKNHRFPPKSRLAAQEGGALGGPSTGPGPGRYDPWGLGWYLAPHSSWRYWGLDYAQRGMGNPV
jgi:hypothetical protein